jgi:hypothetical protein
MYIRGEEDACEDVNSGGGSENHFASAFLLNFLKLLFFFWLCEAILYFQDTGTEIHKYGYPEEYSPAARSGAASGSQRDIITLQPSYRI